MNLPIHIKKIVFTKAEVEEIIEACRLLVRHYKRELTLNDCPLCDCLAIQSVCDKCPWMLFEEKDCEDFAIKHGYQKDEDRYYYAINRARHNRTPAWSRKRIMMLTDWIRKLKEAK